VNEREGKGKEREREGGKERKRYHTGTYVFFTSSPANKCPNFSSRADKRILT